MKIFRVTMFLHTSVTSIELFVLLGFSYERSCGFFIPKSTLHEEGPEEDFIRCGLCVQNSFLRCGFLNHE